MRRLALFAMLAACGGGSIPIDELQDEVFETICSTYVSCGYIDDHDTCRMLFGDADVDQNLIAAVDAGKVIYHSDKARECLDGLAGSCERGTLGDSDGNTACDETFEGTVGAGGQCALDEECISQTCDVPGCPDACCQGTCVGDAPPVRPRVGETCQIDGPDCLGSYCDEQTTTCVAYRETGASCTRSAECETGICSNQVCTALPGPGEPCGPQLGFGLCNHVGYTCSPTSMTCVKYALLGDACTADSDCSPVYDCGPSGTCELGPTLGESCAGPNGTVECVDRSFCDAATMTCTAPKADGQPCDADAQCTSDFCDATGTCATEPICI